MHVRMTPYVHTYGVYTEHCVWSLDDCLADGNALSAVRQLYFGMLPLAISANHCQFA